MKVQLTPAALGEVAILRSSGYKGAGFLLGSAIGRFTIIEQLLPLDFNRDSADAVCRSVLANCQQRLRGVFFCRRRPLALDWFLHGWVMVIGSDQIELRRCEFSQRRHQAVLLPLFEEQEE